MYKFGKNIENGNMILRYGEYAATDGIAIDAWDEEGPFADVTICVQGIPLKKNEVILNHDVLFDREFVDSFLEYLAEGARPVHYGYANSYAIKLKDNWKDLCVPMEE